MKTPTPTQMELAADWLEINDGDGADEDDEGPACRYVAKWLRQRAKKSEETQAVAAFAAEKGISRARVRVALRRMNEAARAARKDG